MWLVYTGCSSEARGDGRVQQCKVSLASAAFYPVIQEQMEAGPRRGGPQNEPPHPSPRGHSPQRRSETLGPQPRPARTCSLLSSTASVVLLAPGLAAFQNCFWAEYRFMGHSLKRQSRRERNKMCYGGRTHPGTGKPSPGTLRGRYQLRVAQGPFQTPPLTMNSRHHNVRLHMRKLRLLEGKPVVT